MKRASDYDVHMIGQVKLQLENLLISSIADMLDGESKLETDIKLKGADCITSITIDEDFIYLEKLEYDTDGEEYSSEVELGDMDVNELYEVWDYLRDLN